MRLYTCMVLVRAIKRAILSILILQKKFGCNLYLPRMADHGIDTTEPMASFSADRVWGSAKEAYEIGTKLGKKVILLSTSTGGTLALKLATEYPDIAALIMLSLQY